jgi:hypothetical protein
VTSVAIPLILFLLIGISVRKFDNRTRLLVMGVLLFFVLVLVYRY